MTLTPGLYAANAMRTILQRIRTHFELGFGATYAGRVNYGDPLFDVTALDPRNTARQFWTTLNFLVAAPGADIPMVLQVDHFYEAGDAGDAGGDPYGYKVAAVADDFRISFGRGGIASDRGFQVYDYSVTPATPTATDEWFLIINSRGSQGMPESEVPAPVEHGLRRITQTYQIKSASDLASPMVYF